MEVRYVYDGMLTVQERDANNLAMVSYTRGNDLSGTLQGAGGIGGLLARSEMANLQSPHSYYHADGNGNFTALVDTNGFLVAKYNYDPYGNLLGMSGPMAEANSYRFSSKEYQGNAALYYYGYRFYEPNLQRWLNRDPIKERGGLNLFGFVQNNPMGAVDLFGHGWIKNGLKGCKAASQLQEIYKKQKSLRKAVRSLEKNIADHRKTLEDYLKDPDKFDNKGFLKDAPPARREKIIETRKKHLEQEMAEWQKQIEKSKKELSELDSAAAALGSAACTVFTPHTQELTELEQQGGDVSTMGVISGVTLDIIGGVDPGVIDVIEWIAE